MKLFTVPLFSLLLLAAACGKQEPLPVPDKKPLSVALTQVPQKLSENMVIAKKVALPKQPITLDEHARNVLQIALGLRDAARNKPHKISALSSGSIFTIDGTPSRCSFSSTVIATNEETCTTALVGEMQDSHLKFSVATTAKQETPHTTLQLSPLQTGSVFSPQFLEEAYDALEVGYASNEISLMLALDNRHTTLCRRGSEYSMKVTLEPQAITYCIDGYGIDPHQFLTTMLNIPKAANAAPSKESSPMAKRILFILMPRDFQDLEFSAPHNALTKAGHTVDIASLSSGTCTGSAGLLVTPTHLLSAMKPADFDQYEAVVITGGFGSPTFLWDNEEVHSVVRYFHEHKKLVATICWASVVPARAGILQNRTATLYPTDDAKQIFVENKVIFNDALCVPLEKERIITAQSPSAVEPFIEAILKQLQPQTTLKEPLHG